MLKFRIRLGVLILLLGVSAPVTAATECVVLLHGLARVSDSMAEMRAKLGRSGFHVININYPSTRHEPKMLALDAVGRGLRGCRAESANTIHFVTHSLGGILLRLYLRDYVIPELGRVVMLGPPNQGSELVDTLEDVPGFGLLGPTGSALGTEDGDLVSQLPPVDFELGVIAGDFNLNPLSLFMIEGPNDSIVSVDSTRVEGMDDHIVLPVMHSVMMRDNEVIDHTIHFLKTGAFIPE